MTPAQLRRLRQARQLRLALEAVDCAQNYQQARAAQRRALEPIRKQLAKGDKAVRVANAVLSWL